MTGAAQLLEVCRRTIDPRATVVRCHGARVMCAATRLGEVIVKLHHRSERRHQELRAYQRWVPALGDRAPRLLATTDSPPALVVTALPGQLLAGGNVAPDAERNAHRQAGALLRDLHNAGPPRPRPDMTSRLHERGMAWLDAVHDLIPDQRRAEIANHLDALRGLGPIPAVPCHLDFTPSNLLRSDDGTLRLVDFEHARYDLAARDLVRLAIRTWTARPDLEEAFQTTYGTLTGLDREVIAHCRHLDELTRTARAHNRRLPLTSPGSAS